MRIDPLDFPQVRTAPESVVRDLEAIDPTYGLLHSRGNRWLLCRYAPDRIDITQAHEMFKNWKGALDRGARYTQEAYVRLRQAKLATKGWRQVAVYRLRNDDFGMIVNDAQGSQWMRNHTSDNEVFQEIDDIEYQRRKAARAEIASIDRAKDLCRYVNTRSHAPGISLTPPDRIRSGYQRVMSIA